MMASYDRTLERRSVDPEPTGGVALRVEIDHEDAVAESASWLARFTTVVVLPTPPFWFAQAIVWPTQ